MVVRFGSTTFETGSLLKPTTAISAGIRMPDCFNATMQLMAQLSFATNMASGQWVHIKNFGFTAS